MSTGKKILIGIGVAIAALAIAGIAVHQSRKDVVTVQTGKAERQDLASVVSASGEIKPKTYVNIGANAFGKITRLYVKEGDRVKKGQLLAQLENVQSSADVNATQAASCRRRDTDAIAADAALNTSQADLNRAQSDYERAKLDWDRAQGLYQRRADREVGIRQPEGMRGRPPMPDWRRPRRASRKPKRKRIPPIATSRRTSANLTHAADRSAKDHLRRAVRRHDHEPAGTRRRNGGDRHPELARQHADDDWPTCR